MDNKPFLPKKYFDELKDFESAIPAMPPEAQSDAKDFVKFTLDRYSKAYDAPFETIPAKDTNIGLKALDVGARALDYFPGIARTAVAAPIAYAAEKITGKDVLQSRDVKRALMGNAPTSAEYMERAGVPEGGSLADVVPGIEKGAWYDPTLRGTAGTALDLAASFGTSALGRLLSGSGAKAKELSKLAGALRSADNVDAAKAAKDAYVKTLKSSAKPLLPGTLGQIVGGVGEAGAMMADPTYGLKVAGKSLYKAPFRQADLLTEGTNIIPPSEFAYESGIQGSPHDIVNQFSDIVKKSSEERKSIIGLAGFGNGPISTKVLKREIQGDVIKSLRDLTGQAGAPSEAMSVLGIVRRDLKPLRKSGAVPIKEAEKIVQTFQKKASALGSYMNPAEAPTARASSEVERNLLKKTYEDLAKNGQNAIANAIEEAIPGGSADYYRAGQRQATAMNALESFGENLGSKGTMDELRKSPIKSFMSALPGMTIGASMAIGGNPILALPIGGSILAGGLATGTTKGASAIGQALKKAGSGNIRTGQHALKAGLTQEESSRRKYESVWEKLLKKYKEQ